MDAPGKQLRPILQLGSLRGYHWNHLDISVAGLPEALVGFRILHISDTHLTSRWTTIHDEFLKKLQQDPPDLILHTGDFVENVLNHRDAVPNVRKLVAGLHSRLGLYGITGNHDGDLLGPKLPAMGVHLIDKRYVRLESEHAAIELIGLPGVRRQNFDPDFIDAIPPRQLGVPRFVLSHFPDHVRFVESLHADAFLTGHTHGGQVCLPNGRPIITHDSLPKHLASGIHRVHGTLLVVNRGFGMSRWSVRLFCPAEVIEIRLVRGK